MGNVQPLSAVCETYKYDNFFLAKGPHLVLFRRGLELAKMHCANFKGSQMVVVIFPHLNQSDFL